MKKPERHNIGNGAPVLCVAGMCKEDRNMKKLMDLVQELSFVRVGGSEEEKRAAELIVEEISQAAGDAGREDIRGEYETFRIPDAKVEKCSVTAAGREIPCVPFLRSGSIDRECELRTGIPGRCLGD